MIAVMRDSPSDPSAKRGVFELAGNLTGWYVVLLTTVHLVIYLGVPGLVLLLPSFFLYVEAEWGGRNLVAGLALSLPIAILSEHLGWLTLARWLYVLSAILAYCIVVVWLTFEHVCTHPLVRPASDAAFQVSIEAEQFGFRDGERLDRFVVLAYGKPMEQLEAENFVNRMNCLRVTLCLLGPSAGLAVGGAEGLLVAVIALASALFPWPSLALPGWLYSARRATFGTSVTAVGTTLTILAFGRPALAMAAFGAWIAGSVAAIYHKHHLYGTAFGPRV